MRLIFKTKASLTWQSCLGNRDESQITVWETTFYKKEKQENILGVEHVSKVFFYRTGSINAILRKMVSSSALWTVLDTEMLSEA